jgi:hypothetical protein
MQTGGSFGAYQQYAQAQGMPFPAWRADEECPQAANMDDTLEIFHPQKIDYCALGTQAAPAIDPDHPVAATSAQPGADNPDAGNPGAGAPLDAGTP